MPWFLAGSVPDGDQDIDDWGLACISRQGLIDLPTDRRPSAVRRNGRGRATTGNDDEGQQDEQASLGEAAKDE